MALLLLIPALLLMPITALAVMRSAWGRHALAYACLGLATALPLWAVGCTKDSQQTRSHEDSEHDADRARKADKTEQAAESPAPQMLAFRIAADPTATDLQPYKTQLDEQGPSESPDAKYRWFEVDDLEQYVDDPAQRSEVEHLLAMSQEESSQQSDARRQVEEIFASREVVARPYAGRPMAVLIDNNVLTTPNINQALSTNVQISGEFSEAEIRYLLDSIRRTESGRSP